METPQKLFGGRWLANTDGGLLPVDQVIMGWLAGLDPTPTSFKVSLDSAGEGIRTLTGEDVPGQLIAFLDGTAFPPSIREEHVKVTIQGFEMPDARAGKSKTRSFHCTCPADSRALAELARASAPGQVMGPEEMAQIPTQALEGVNITMNVAQVLQVSLASYGNLFNLMQRAWEADVSRFASLKDLVFEIGRMHAMDGPRMHLELAKLQSEERKDLAQMDAVAQAKERQEKTGLWLQGLSQIGGIVERTIERHPEHAASLAKGIEGIGAAAAKIARSGE